MSDQNIILDTHEFLTDVTLQAQYEWGGSRKIYRHESDQGSVIEIDYWGSPMKLFVADAKYRATGLAYDTSPRLHGNPRLMVTTAFFNGSADDPTEALSYTKDDAWIQSTYAALRNDGTAKSNTDKLMEFSTTEAAHHCRSQNISGVGQLDLPNLYELIILYLESDNIDALDPTVESNRDKALGMMNTNGRFEFNKHAVRSGTGSSERLRIPTAWVIYNNGAPHAYSTNSLNQSTKHGVVPVKELITI